MQLMRPVATQRIAIMALNYFVFAIFCYFCQPFEISFAQTDAFRWQLISLSIFHENNPTKH